MGSSAIARHAGSPGHGAPGVDVRRIDVAADELPRGAFDFVHTRHVLIHLPSRDEVLARLADALRPGGVLLRAREGHGVGTAPGTSRVTATTGSDGILRGRLNDAAHYIELAP